MSFLGLLKVLVFVFVIIYLLHFLKGIFFKRPLKRDVSRLGSPGDEDLVEELIDLDGGPLKEGNLRRALRDARLLPKRKPQFSSPFSAHKRKKYMEAAEANRLFSATMRTRDRNIRDLLPDEEQLERYGLPVWRNEPELAEALGLTLGELRFFSIHREKERAPHYVTFSVPKRGGGRRLIMAPKKRIKAIQRRLLSLLVNRLPVSDYAHGFLRGRSVRTGAEPHVGRQVVLHMDIKDFFPSVHFGRVRGLLIAYGYGFPVANTLAVIMTEAVRQPVQIDDELFHVPVGPRYCVQGAPTSPGLCNAVVRRMDLRLGGLARSFGFEYTRYADDMTFSGDRPEDVYGLLKAASRIVSEEGFEVHPRKTRIMRSGRRQTVTGVVVNEQLGLSRRERRRLRAMGHGLARQIKEGAPDPVLLSRFNGKLAYLTMLNPDQAEALRTFFLNQQ